MWHPRQPGESPPSSWVIVYQTGSKGLVGPAELVKVNRHNTHADHRLKQKLLFMSLLNSERPALSLEGGCSYQDLHEMARKNELRWAGTLTARQSIVSRSAFVTVA